MSASNTNLEKQTKRHRGPLFGIAAALIFAGVLFVGFAVWTSYQSDNASAESPATYITE